MNKNVHMYQLLLMFLFLITHSMTMPSLRHFSIDSAKHSFYFNRLPEEGFCAGTLIKIPGGYELIENLVVDNIVIDASGKQTKISAITKHFVDKCIKIYVKDTFLYAGCDQQFFCPSSLSWISVYDLPYNSELITKPIVIHALTTQSSTLCVSPNDISAHNAMATFGGAPSICCGYIAITNPIIAVLGGITVSLAIIAHNTYQTYIEEYKNENVYVAAPDSIVFAERFYYEQKKESLELLKQELLMVKNGLQIIKKLSSSDLTYQLLSHHTYEIKNKVQFISIAQEKKLSDIQKKALRNSRENELASLEKQICDIQFLLALHVNQLIENVEYINNLYKEIDQEIQKTVTIWNNNLDEITHEKAWELLKWSIAQEHLVHVMRRACNELFMVAEYYRACTSYCIQASTTIIATLEHFACLVDEINQSIAWQTEITRNNSAIIEKYFAVRAISTETFKNNILHEFNKRQKQRDTDTLKKIEMQCRVNSGFAGGPKKDDNDEEENNEHFWKNLKSRSDKSARSLRFGKMYRDPVTELWWSRDLSKHGGSTYKVFKEGAKGFDWLFDAVEDGTRMLNKHKSPIGIFIPYKEVIFKT